MQRFDYVSTKTIPFLCRLNEFYVNHFMNSNFVLCRAARMLMLRSKVKVMILLFGNE